uniref:E3 ubiquitin-protein ligase n=3 Tax=Pseudocrenilabrinae TaxID=318546 RepID=A0A3Q4I1C7_NEOBR
MLLASAVVVWEWLNEHGRWRPYSPAVCHHIEAVIRSDPRCGSVVLGQVDSRLSPYIIDLHSMHQFRQDTGTLRPVRRSFYDPTSAPGQGWLWEWENDAGSWTAYDTEVGIAIQAARDRQQPWLDLAPLGFCYLIDFESMTQINGQTQRCRRIQRRSDLAYPLVSGPLPKSHHAWGPTSMPGHGGLLGPCACQQCMLVLSVKAGTMSTAHTLGRRPPQTKPPSPKLSSLPIPGGSYSLTLPRPPTLSRSLSPHRTSMVGATGGFNIGGMGGAGGLSRPALQRIAMAQSRALIASGVPTVPVKNLNGSSPVHPALAGITGILMSAAGLPVCLTRPPKLVLHPPPVSKSDLKPVPGLGHCCRKTTKKQARKGKTPEEVVKRYLQKVRNPPEEDCTICMEALPGPSGYKGPGVGGISRAESVGRLAQCGHQYHLQCLVAMYNNGNKDGSLQCPTCKTIYGVKTGNQPPGKMEYHVIPHSLPGHPDCKTIRIIYNIPPGIQGPEHPNPGKPFTARGFPRHCYLPDSEKGRKVLRLLLVAWDRRLIFSVGTSSTTGESDTVIWNEVHHKTEFGSNLTGHGYPDPGHLDNVLEELKAQGITEEECLPRD